MAVEWIFAYGEMSQMLKIDVSHGGVSCVADGANALDSLICDYMQDMALVGMRRYRAWSPYLPIAESF